MPKPKAWMAWSSGKDCAWALHLERERLEVDVTALLTTFTDPYDRVSMHGVREELVLAQAEAAGVPLRAVRIPARCTHETYAERMRVAMLEAAAEGVSEVVFGDIFLDGIRAYREQNLAQVGMAARFPLWGRGTAQLAREMISGGLRARVTCLNPEVTPRELAGRAFDEELLASLPEGVDPCAERGEFHTFVWDAPCFDRAVFGGRGVEVDETIEREGFVFTDVLPASG